MASHHSLVFPMSVRAGLVSPVPASAVRPLAVEERPFRVQAATGWARAANLPRMVAQATAAHTKSTNVTPDLATRVHRSGHGKLLPVIRVSRKCQIVPDSSGVKQEYPGRNDISQIGLNGPERAMDLACALVGSSFAGRGSSSVLAT